MTERYKNKRMMVRRGGRFAKPSPSDFGIGGVCEVCQHLMLRYYDGDPRDEFPDPRAFRYRCFHCEPKTEQEFALEAEIEAGKPKRPGVGDVLLGWMKRDGGID